MSINNTYVAEALEVLEDFSLEFVKGLEVLGFPRFCQQAFVWLSRFLHRILLYINCCYQS